MRFPEVFVVACWCSVLLVGAARAQPAPAPPPPTVEPAPGEAPPDVVVLPTIDATRVDDDAPPVALTADEALAEYRRQVIFLDEEEWLTLTAQRVGDHVYGRVTRSHAIHAKRGEQRESLDGADFYDAVGRSDLADSYRTRRNLYIGFSVGFGALMVYGVYEAVQSFRIRDRTFDNDDCQLDDDFVACIERDRIADAKLEDEADGHFRRALIGAGVGVAVGVVAAAIYRRRHPVSEGERRFLVTKYNRSLRARLGIPEPQILDVGAYPTSGGGGLVVTGQF